MVPSGYRLLALADLSAQAWKNGGGTTRELAAFDGEPGSPVACRFSVADIDTEGPFSDFAGYDRHMALVDGAGVILQGDGVAYRLARGDGPIAFSGDRRLGARLWTARPAFSMS